MLPINDPDPYAHTPEGVARAEDLAAQTMENLVATTEIARLDTTIVSLMMLAEILAGLDVYAGMNAAAALKQVRHMTAERVELTRTAEDGCPRGDTAARASARQTPGASVYVPGRVLH